MSCYSKHPDLTLVECWHGPGHTGDHGKEGRTWLNLEDARTKEMLALRKVADAARRLLDEAAEVPDGGHEATDALSVALKEAGR